MSLLILIMHVSIDNICPMWHFCNRDTIYMYNNYCTVAIMHNCGYMHRNIDWDTICILSCIYMYHVIVVHHSTEPVSCWKELSALHVALNVTFGDLARISWWATHNNILRVACIPIDPPLARRASQQESPLCIFHGRMNSTTAWMSLDLKEYGAQPMNMLSGWHWELAHKCVT